jgi:hypothetical protein
MFDAPEDSRELDLSWLLGASRRSGQGGGPVPPKWLYDQVHVAPALPRFSSAVGRALAHAGATPDPLVANPALLSLLFTPVLAYLAVWILGCLP